MFSLLDSYNDVLSIDELCEVLHIGRNMAYRLLNTQSIQAFRIGRCWKIPKNSVQEFLKQNQSFL